MRYGQILDGKVHYIFESEVQPQFAPNIFIVPLASYPNVKVGWNYNETTGGFTPPVEPSPTPEPEPSPEEETLEIAKEIQVKQAIDTLIKFDALATVFENHESTTLNTYDVLAVLLDEVMTLNEKVDNMSNTP